MTSRIIRRAANQSKAAVGDLLGTLFAAELLAPSKRLIFVSPWISDFPVLDNRGGDFGQLDPRWGATYIRLSSVLRALLTRGTVIQLACRPGLREDAFTNRLYAAAIADGTDANLKMQNNDIALLAERAHEKALIADNWALHGSMNFTYSGVEINGELVTFTTDTEKVATIAAEFGSVFR